MPEVAEMVSGVSADTELVVTINVAEVVFAATVTLAGTCAATVLLLESVTTVPPFGAGPFSVTVPIAVAPAGTDVGLRVTELRTAVDADVKFTFITCPVLTVTTRLGGVNM